MLHGKRGMNIMWQLFHYSTDIFSFTILLVMNSRSEAEVEVCDSFSNTKYIRVTIEAMTKIDHKSPLSSALLVRTSDIGLCLQHFNSDSRHSWNCPCILQRRLLEELSSSPPTFFVSMVYLSVADPFHNFMHACFARFYVSRLFKGWKLDDSLIKCGFFKIFTSSLKGTKVTLNKAKTFALETCFFF